MYELYDNLLDNFFVGEPARNYLKTDIIENETGYKLMIDIPGVKKEDIKLSYQDRYLKVSYNASKENEEKENKYLKKERFFRNVSRSYSFNDIDPNSIKASYTDGVLTIELEKKIENSVKSIEIL